MHIFPFEDKLDTVKSKPNVLNILLSISPVTTNVIKESMFLFLFKDAG
jgi:hypothetical protein